MIYAAYIFLGAVIGTVLMIVISVMVVSGRQSDEEYRHDLEEYEGTVDGSEGLNRNDK